MYIKFILVTLIPLVLSIGTIPGLGLDLFQEADAKKSDGMNTPGRIGVKSYGSANNGIVCGDRLCSDLMSKDATPQVSPYLLRPVIFSEQYVTNQVTKEFSSPIDLSGQNLYGKSLNHLDLRYANLANTNLKGADLEGVDLTGVNLQFSFLDNTNLDGAILKDANLSNSKMLRAYLRNADLSNANLSNVDFRWADLTSANLTNANLQYATLFRANFASTDLNNADLVGVGTGTTNFNDCMNHPACLKYNHVRLLIRH
jgi:uncharacterized protein YjbI with pentapeptide repeats